MRSSSLSFPSESTHPLRWRAVLTCALAASLALAGCSSSGSRSKADSAPSSTAAKTSAPSSDEEVSSGAGVGTRRGDTPTIAPPPSVPATPTPTAPWTPPSLKFYNDDYSVWYQDDSVINPDSVSTNGNIEGYQTYDGQCVGFELRDIDEEIHTLGLADDIQSEIALGTTQEVVSNYVETSREVVDYVIDDDGTMQGYSVTYTGELTETQEPIQGYRFVRLVEEAGLHFEVYILCGTDSVITPEQWATILKGTRIEGLDAGPMTS